MATQRQSREQAFTFSAMEALHEITNVMTNAQLGLLFVLQSYMDFDGVIVMPSGKPMTTRDMISVLKVADRTFYDFLTVATENNVVIKRSGEYVVNKRYHFRGPLKDRPAVKSFSRNIRKAYNENKPESLGLIYRLLPFVNYRTNTISYNPNESVPERVRPMKAKDIAKAIGVAPATFSRIWRDWSFGGEYVMAKVSVGRQTHFMFNPWIIYRGVRLPDNSMRAIFAEKVITGTKN